MKRALPVLFLLLALSSASAQEEQQRRRSQYIFAPVVQEQREQIAQDDAANAELDAELAGSRTEAQNALIQSNAQIINERAAAVLAESPDQSMAALRQVIKIERLKRNIQEFRENDDYETDSPEVGNLLETLEEEYEALSGSTYTATSLDRHLVLRAGSYDQNVKAWRANIYSDFFSYTTLFSHSIELPYQELFGRHESFSGNSAQGERERFITDITIADSLFRQALPLVYARLRFRVIKWKNASEYRFIPLECEVIRTDTGKVVRKFSHDELTQETFILHPPVEIRSEAQKNRDIEEANRLLEKEDQLYETEKPRNPGIPLFSEQQGRRAIYISADTRLYKKDLEEFDVRNVKLNSLRVNLDFGLGSFSFLGGSAGYDYDGSFERTDYSIGFNGGFNLTLRRLLRPYVMAEGTFHTNYDGVFTLGGGLDVILGKLMLNVNYGYNWNYNFESKLLRGGSDNDRDPNLLRYYTFAAGVGFTW